MNKKINNIIISKKLLPNQRFRQSIGDHTRWVDKRQGSQKDQDTRVQRLSRHQGIHSGNVHRQNFTHALVHLIARVTIMNSVEFNKDNNATTQKNIVETSPSYKDYQQTVSHNLTNYEYHNNYPLRISRQTNLNSTGFYNQHAHISKPVPEITSQEYVTTASPNLSITDITKNKYSIAHPIITGEKNYKHKKTHIINQIIEIMNDPRFTPSLKNTFDIILRLSEHAPEVRHARKEYKELLLILKCIQQTHFFILSKNNFIDNENFFIHELWKLAYSFDNPVENQMINEFREKYISRNATEIVIGTSQLTDISRTMKLVGDMIVLSSQKEAVIVFNEKNRLLNELFLENNSTRILYGSQPSPYLQLNNLVNYLLNDNNSSRISEVAEILVNPLGKNKKHIDEDYLTSNDEKIAIIGNYMNQVILNMTLYDFILKKIQTHLIRSDDNLLVTNRNLQLWLRSITKPLLEDKSKLTKESLEFYTKNGLKKFLPTTSLNLGIADSKEMLNMDITHPQWGFIHAGALLLSDSKSDLNGLKLSDIEDIGILLNVMIREGLVPNEYAAYFKLPAYIHHVKQVSSTIVSVNSKKYNLQIFLSYFDYIEQWEKNNNPLEQFNICIKDWKTRTDLAKEHFSRYNISDKWLTNYLNSHSEMSFTSVDEKHPINSFLINYRTQGQIYKLPNIDKVFEEQNIKLGDAVYNLDIFLLQHVFNSLNEDEQRFIDQSKVGRIRAQFNIVNSVDDYSFWSVDGSTHLDQFGYHISDDIDLLGCSMNGEERVYALLTVKNANQYSLTRVDRDRAALLDLLNDSRVPRENLQYQLKVTSHLILKEKNDPSGKLIENLAEVHKKKLLIKLYNQGYDKTTQEKVKDFLLSLIPFYTCITEGVKGNEQEATLACIFDVISLGIPLGRAAYIGSRFSVALGGSATMALRYGARQATIRQMIKESGNKFIKYIPFVKNEIPPRLSKKLTNELLSSLDPGFGLLRHGGRAIKSLENIFLRMKNKSPGISRLLTELNKFKGTADEGMNLLTANINKYHIPKSNYIRYSFKSDKGSEILIVSAHGGFTISDISKPVVILPSDITIKFLTPHGTMLYDPGLDDLINNSENLKTYLTIENAKITKVDFLPQKTQPRWKMPPGYDPSSKFNTLGRDEGLQNYRHFRYAGESDSLISEVLTKNHELAKTGKAILTDIITVDSKIDRVAKSSTSKASVQRIIDLDRSGKLINEKGERYKTIVFCHCRNNFEQKLKSISGYYMNPKKLQVYNDKTLPASSSVNELKMTLLSRANVNDKFTIKNYKLGKIELTFLKAINQTHYE